MKSIYITFTDEEHATLKNTKTLQGKNWHDFILSLSKSLHSKRANKKAMGLIHNNGKKIRFALNPNHKEKQNNDR